MNVPVKYSYWVIPGRLLSGEYPIAQDLIESREKLTALKHAGVSCFIDLTTPGDNLLPYEELLSEVYGDTPAARHSFPIRDYSIPENRATMQRILDAIDLELLAGRVVYVHCRGGIGRTGTVTGCYIARYCGSEDPLGILAEMWKTNPKSARYPDSPQTDEQVDYVKTWNDSARLLSRARGSLFGQLAGDSLGSLVEFKGPGEISALYPKGLRELADGGTFNTIAGQPTDDSEMALLLARILADDGEYDEKKVFQSYCYWLDSGPFDCGNTIHSALRGTRNHESQANGALMRVSPLGIFGGGLLYREGLQAGPGGFRVPRSGKDGDALTRIADMARLDAALTHPHRVCLQANELYATAIARAVSTGMGPEVLYRQTLKEASSGDYDASLVTALKAAADEPPRDFTKNQGWVLIAFQNAFYRLLHAPDPETGIVDTVMQGGDTDTNAAICGALLGAVHGIEAMPKRWVDAVSNCRPEAGREGVHRPRPEVFWPSDAKELAGRLVGERE